MVGNDNNLLTNDLKKRHHSSIDPSLEGAEVVSECARKIKVLSHLEY